MDRNQILGVSWTWKSLLHTFVMLAKIAIMTTCVKNRYSVYKVCFQLRQGAKQKFFSFPLHHEIQLNMSIFKPKAGHLVKPVVLLL